jgi:hypothetical protein
MTLIGRPLFPSITGIKAVVVVLPSAPKVIGRGDALKSSKLLMPVSART